MRRYKDLKCIFQVEDPVADPVLGVVKTRLRRFLFSSNFENIACPLGIGNHVDHLIVRGALEQIIGEGNLAAYLFLYEDLPYAASISLNTIERLTNRTNFRLSP
jgi:hypothetical protein